MGYGTSADGTRLVARQQLLLGRAAFQRTDDASTNMAINGENDSIDVIWNGTGAEDTGGDWTHSGQGTETAESMHSGTNGMDSGIRSTGQDTRFDYGSNQDIAGSYDSISFWMQPKAFPGGAELKVHWKTSGGMTKGNNLKVNDYVSDFDLDVWQKVTIPIDDFVIPVDVAKIEFTYASQSGQHFWFDDFELNQGGIGPKTFRVQSPAEKVWHVERVALVISAGDAGWDSTAFADIAGGLASGLLLKYHKIGAEPEVYWTINCKNNIELFGNYSVVNNVNFASNDVMIVFALEPQLTSIILVDDDEVLDFLIRDDVDSLARMRAFLHYGIEEIST